MYVCIGGGREKERQSWCGYAKQLLLYLEQHTG